MSSFLILMPTEKIKKLKQTTGFTFFSFIFFRAPKFKISKFLKFQKIKKRKDLAIFVKYNIPEEDKIYPDKAKVPNKVSK